MAKLEKTVWTGNVEKQAGEEWDAFYKRQEAALKVLQDASDKLDPRGDDLVGAVIRFQVADGYAVYRVTKNEPLTLQHVKCLDAYSANPATIRGVNKNTVRSQLAQARAWASMGDSNKDFYASLKVGQTIHYHNSFGSWIRCVVVRGESVHDKGVEQNVLKPVALVGDWRPYDLPKRMPDGSVQLGYHAESVVNGKTMTPHESTLWESPNCADRSRRHEVKDPSTLPAISLEVPGLSEEEERKAALWRKVARLRAIVNDHRCEDPQVILDALKSSLEAA